MPINTFLAEVEKHLKSDKATEHTYRPSLQKLFDTVLAPATAINEPKHAVYGAPDFIIQQGNTPVGHVEAKDVGVDLEKIVADSEKDKPSTDNGKQLKRYRAALPNLLYTDGLVWYWFVGGVARLEHPVRIATWEKAKKRLNISSNATTNLTALLKQFAGHKVTTVNTPAELAQRLAQIARWLRDVIVEVFKGQGEEGDLHQQLEAFRKTLLPTLKPGEFADMYAQTIVYGLFAARVSGPTKPIFTRFDAAQAIPKTNPFLRRLFQEIAGYDLDDRIAWLVDDCAHLLERTDMEAVLRDFGKATRQEDPVVHFYETFLAAYDPKLREVRGVYYTPEPVVSYIVRSVDALLRTKFGKSMGLADDKTIILDPATGTATFLQAVVQHIHGTLVDQGMAGTWNSYVATKLLPRVFGFELLMAPYTVAHLKVGLLLDQLGYKFGSNERLGIYLTNALTDPPTGQQALAFAQYIAEEGQAANKVKHEKPVMVVLGNPPYSGISANQGVWMDRLLRGKLPDGTAVSSYYEVDGKPLGEKKLWLQDDYVKFIRFAQWRIHSTGEGILAYISNNGYLDNPTFRGMRQSLLREFDEVYILNLHGDAKKHERAPDDSPDKNVFDIQQGVAIGIFIKHKKTVGVQARVYYADLWGDRPLKYEVLASQDILATEWREVVPNTPYYFFVPREETVRAEYECNPKIDAIFPVNSAGIITARDHFVVDFSDDELLERIAIFRNKDRTDDDIRREFFSGKGSAKYDAGDSRGWKLTQARLRVQNDDIWRARVAPYAYRPFDTRRLYDTPWMVDWPRLDVIHHMVDGGNLALHICRQIVSDEWRHALVTDRSVDDCYVSNKTRERGYAHPLYLYPDREQVGMFAGQGTGPGDRRPNLSHAFITDLDQSLGLRFIPDGRGDLQQSIGPEDVFHYAYAIFHSPTYRSRYAEFLKIDFPRLPLTSNRELFAALAAKGADLVDLHLLRLPGDLGVGGNGGAKVLVSPGKQGVTFPKAGSGTIDKIAYIAPHDSQPGRITINNAQYFEGIEPETWEIQIGGYQPLEKWLKDRRNRTLTVDEIQHYLRMVIALRETRRIMSEIDELIPQWPLT